MSWNQAHWAYVTDSSVCVKTFMTIVDKCSPIGVFGGGSFKNSDIEVQILINGTGGPGDPPKDAARDVVALVYSLAEGGV